MRIKLVITILLLIFATSNVGISLQKGNFEEKNKLTRAENYFAKGYFQDAIDLYRQVEEEKPEDLKIMMRIGECLYWLGNLPYALKQFEIVKDKAEVRQSKLDIANALHNIGEIYRLQKKYEEAIDVINQAIDDNLSVGNQMGLSANYNTIAKIYCSKREFYEAIKYFERALKIKKINKDLLGIGITLNDQGLMYYYMDELELAEKYYSVSLKYLDKVNALGYKSTVYSNLGALYLKQDELEKATSSFKEAKNIDNKSKNYAHFAKLLVNQAIISEKRGDIKEALRLVDRAIMIYRERNINFDLFAQYQKYLEDLL